MPKNRVDSLIGKKRSVATPVINKPVQSAYAFLCQKLLISPTAPILRLRGTLPSSSCPTKKPSTYKAEAFFVHLPKAYPKVTHPKYC